jgi:hypothetical protein
VGDPGPSGSVPEVIPPLPSAEACRTLRAEIGPRVLFAFSCGKDSIAAWLQLRRFFDEVCPFYLEYVPGIPFMERSLAYYESFFGTKILRLPGCSFWGLMDSSAYQPPGGTRWLRAQLFPRRENPDTIDQFAAFHYGFPLAAEQWIAGGPRRGESMGRAIIMKRVGAFDRRPGWGQLFHCIYDWSDARVMEELNAAGVKLPVDYRLFGRSFEGLRGRFLLPIKQHLPESWAYLENIFPLLRLELVRYQDEQRTSPAAWLDAHPRERERIERETGLRRRAPARKRYAARRLG